MNQKSLILREKMRQLAREPLLHFLLLGAVIFAAYSLLSKNRRDRPLEILVTHGQLENLVTLFARTWHRPPSDEEMQGLLREYVREEAAYREAMEQGLDRDDTIVRRRLRQKLEFLATDVATQAEPTNADLQAYLQAHPQDFHTEATIAFEQVYLDPQKHGANLERDAGRVRDGLTRAGKKTPIDEAGDPFLLEHRFASVPLSEVAKMFGTEFVAAISKLPTGQWQGPVNSGYGAHLVLINERTEATVPPLEQVRDAVRRDWNNTKRTEATEKFYQGLLKRYTIKIEPASEKKVAEARR